LEAYSDEPGNTGLLVNQPEYIERITNKCMNSGFQVCTHAIGDRGVREVLDIYQKTLAQRPPGDYRWRVEHAQVISAQDMGRFAKLGLLASMQPTHATSDMPWAEKRLGRERIRGAYAWKSILSSGAHLALGSDFPIESPNPLLGIYAAVTRQDPSGSPAGGWQPQEKLSLQQAVNGFTREAAYAAFLENSLGSIKVGKVADFTVLGEDIFKLPPAKIPAVQVIYTLVGGNVVYDLHEKE
jgi:predicted amidohydrolase YtcJ